MFFLQVPLRKVYFSVTLASNDKLLQLWKSVLKLSVKESSKLFVNCCRLIFWIHGRICFHIHWPIKNVVSSLCENLDEAGVILHCSIKGTATSGYGQKAINRREGSISAHSSRTEDYSSGRAHKSTWGKERRADNYRQI